MTLNGREVEIEIDDVTALKNVDGVQAIIIGWSGNIGFGEYTLYTDGKGRWHGDSEHMDKGDDKEFIRLLLDKFVERLVIDE